MSLLLLHSLYVLIYRPLNYHLTKAKAKETSNKTAFSNLRDLAMKEKYFLNVTISVRN